MISNELLIRLMVEKIREFVWLDSLVWLDPIKLHESLVQDYNRFGHFLNETECLQFVYGDSDGEIPPDLIAKFPNTNKYLYSELS